nr:MAG TPA: hypothetical protein [Caudoviricetes sp.]
MEYVKINNQIWKVRILAIKENFNILDTDNAGRVIEKGKMTLDRIGTFYGHNVTFGKWSMDKDARDDYDNLFNFLAYPRNDGIAVELVHNQTVINYMAYTSTGEREIAWIDQNNNIVNWKNFSCNFIPMEAQVVPGQSWT